MPDISGSVKKLYNLLIKDPDYQDTPSKSREEVVLGEATQRAKQHERNNIALSMAKSSLLPSTNGHSNGNGALGKLTKLLETGFLMKQGRPPRTPGEALLNFTSPKTGITTLMTPLKEEIALQKWNKDVSGVMPRFLSDLKRIFEGVEVDEKPVDIASLELQVNLVEALMAVEVMLSDTPNISMPDLRTRLVESEVAAFTPQQAETYIVNLGDRLAYGGDRYKTVQEERIAAVNNLLELTNDLPKLPEGWEEKCWDEGVGYSQISQNIAEGTLYDIQVDEQGQIVRGTDGHPVLTGEAIVNFVKSGFIVEGGAEKRKAYIADKWPNLREALLTAEGRSLYNEMWRTRQGQKAIFELAGKDALLNDAAKIDLEQLKQRVEAGDLTAFTQLEIAAIQHLKKRQDNQAGGPDKLSLTYYMAEKLKEMKEKKGIEMGLNEIFEEFGDKEFKDWGFNPNEGYEVDQLMAEYWTQLDKFKEEPMMTSAEAQAALLEEGDLTEEGAQVVKSVQEIQEEQRLLREDKLDKVMIWRFREDWEEGKEHPDVAKALAEYEEDSDLIGDDYKALQVSLAKDGVVSPDFDPLKILTDARKEAENASAFSNPYYREDFADVPANGWLGQEQEKLKEIANKIYTIDGVTEVFLYGASVKDYRSVEKEPEESKPLIGIRMIPEAERYDDDEITDLLEKVGVDTETIVPSVFRARYYSTEVYNKYKDTIVFYGEDFPNTPNILRSQFGPVAGNDIVGGTNADGTPLHAQRSPITLSDDIVKGNLNELLGAKKKKGKARIAIEDANFQIPLDLAHRIANEVDPDIRKLHYNIDYLQGTKSKVNSDAELAENLDHEIFNFSGDGLFPQLIAAFNPREKDETTGKYVTTPVSEETKKKVYDDLAAIFGTETLKEKLKGIPTINHEYRAKVDEKFVATPERREELSQIIRRGLGDTHTLEQEIDEDEDISGYHEIVQNLFRRPQKSLEIDGEWVTEDDPTQSRSLHLEVHRPGIKSYKGLINKEIDSKVTELSTKPLSNVRRDIVLYDETGKSVTLAILVASLPQLLGYGKEIGKGKRERQVNPTKWDMYKPLLVHNTEGEGSGRYKINKEGKVEYIKPQNQEAARVRYLKEYQAVVDMAPEDEQAELVKNWQSHPDMGYWNVFLDPNTDEPIEAGRGEFVNEAGVLEAGPYGGNINLHTFLQDILGLNPDNRMISYNPASTIGTSIEGIEVPEDQNLNDVLLELLKDENINGLHASIPQNALLEEKQDEMWRTISRLPRKGKDALLAQWPQLIRGDYKALNLGVSSIGSGVGWDLASNLVGIIKGFGKGTRDTITMRPEPETPTELADAERRIQSRREFHRGRPFKFDLTDPDFQTFMKHVLREGAEWGETYYNPDTKEWIANIPNEINLSKTIINAKGVEQEVPIGALGEPATALSPILRNFYRLNDEAINFAKLKEDYIIENEAGGEAIAAHENTDFEKRVYINNFIRKQLEGEVEENELSERLRGSYARLLVGLPIKGLDDPQADAKTVEKELRRTPLGAVDAIRAYSDADALAHAADGNLDVGSDYFEDERTHDYFIANYRPFKALADHLGKDSVRDLFEQENLVPTDQTHVLQSVSGAEGGGFRLVSTTSPGKNKIRLDELQTFLRKYMSQSSWGTGEVGTSGLRTNADELGGDLKITSYEGHDKAHPSTFRAHEILPTFYALVRDTNDPNSPLRIQKIFNHGMDASGSYIYNPDEDQEHPLTYLITGEKISKKALRSFKAPSDEEAQFKKGGILSKNGAHRDWTHRRNPTYIDRPSSNKIIEPDTDIIDFTELNKFLTDHRIGIGVDGEQVLQFDTEVDTSDVEDVHKWINEIRSKVAILKAMSDSIAREKDLTGEDKTYWKALTGAAKGAKGQDIGQGQGYRLDALLAALGHPTFGGGESGNGYPYSDRLFQFVDPRIGGEGDGSHELSKTAFGIVKNTEPSYEGTAFQTNLTYRDDMLARIEKTLGNMPGDKLQEIFGEHITNLNRTDPLGVIRQEIKKIEQRGKAHKATNDDFDYDTDVNNEINILLNTVYKAIGPYDAENIRWWKDQPVPMGNEALIEQAFEDMSVDAVTDLQAAIREKNTNILSRLRGDQEKIAAVLGEEESGLTDRERKVLASRFGLDIDPETGEQTGRSRTLQGVADTLGFTRERIRQIEGEALGKLRGVKISQEDHDGLTTMLKANDDSLRLLNSLDPNDIATGNIDPIIKNQLDAIGEETMETAQRFPEFFRKDGRYRYFNRPFEQGVGPIVLGGLEKMGGLLIAPMKLLLKNNQRRNFLTSNLAFSVRIKDVELNDADPDDKFERYHIRLKEDDKILGHLLRDNGTYSVWRVGDFLESVGKLVDTSAPVKGASPILEGLSFTDANAKIKDEVDWFSPIDRLRAVGMVIKHDGIETAINQRVAIPNYYDPQTLEGVSQAAAEAFAKAGLTDKEVKEIKKGTDGKVTLSGTSVDSGTGIAEPLPIIVNKIVQANAQIGTPEGMAENRGEQWRGEKTIMGTAMKWITVLNGDWPNDELDHAIPMLRHLTSLRAGAEGPSSDLPRGMPQSAYLGLNVQNLMDISDKFVDAGLHGGWRADGKVTAGSKDHEYSGMSAFLERLDNLIVGNDLELVKSELEKNTNNTGFLNKIRDILYGIDLVNDDGTKYGLEEALEKKYPGGGRRALYNPQVLEATSTEEANKIRTKDTEGDFIPDQIAHEIEKLRKVPANAELTTADLRKQVIQTMEKGGVIGGVKVAPWKVSKDTAKAILERVDTDDPDFRALVESNNVDTWDNRLYLTMPDPDDPDRQVYNENFLGMTNQDVKYLFAQLIGEDGQVKHHDSMDEEGKPKYAQSVIEEQEDGKSGWTMHNFQAWDKSNYGPRDKNHEQFGKLPRTLREHQIFAVLDKMAEGTFGETDDIRLSNQEIHKEHMAEFTKPEVQPEVESEVVTSEVQPAEVPAPTQSEFDVGPIGAGTGGPTDDDGDKIITGDGEEEDKSKDTSWDNLSTEQQAALEEKYKGIADMEPIVQEGLITAAGFGGDKPPKKVTDIANIMRTKFGVELDEKGNLIEGHPEYQNYLDYLKTVDDKKFHSLWETQYINKIGEDPPPEVDTKELQETYKKLYQQFTTSSRNPEGIELDEFAVPTDAKTLSSRIDDLQLKIRTAREEALDKRHKEKANDLSAINNGQIPEGLSARVLRQYARKAVLHQALYDTEPDNKGKPYMDSESKEMLRAFWLDMGNRTDENGNELVPFNEMRDELVKDGEEGRVSYTNADGKEVKGHAFERRIDEEEQLMRQAEENHEALVNQLNEEGVEALTYPVNGHNILVSPDGQHEREFGAGGEFNTHIKGRNRDAYTGNLLDEKGEKRITQAPQVFGLNFENDEDKIHFKELWNNYYQISNKAVRAQRGQESAGYAIKQQQALGQQIVDEYGPKGFEQEWLREARVGDQHGPQMRPIERNKLGFPVDEKGKPLPLPKVIDPETGEEVDGWYSPSLHAVVNERYFRTLVQESGKYGTNPLYGNHEKVKINQADIRRRGFKESVGANLDMDKPEERAKLQLIQPLDGSPLNESRAVMVTKEGGIYHVRSLAEYTPPSKGPVNPAVFRELVLMHKIADEMATNPEAFTGEIANTLGFSGMQRGTTLDENSLAGDQEALLQTKPVKDMVERSPFARRAAEQHKQNLQASPTARFLASLGGYPREVAARVPAGRILTALARGAVQDFTGNELIPATQTQKNVEGQMAKLRQEAQDAQQRSDVAHILYKPELEKPLPTKEVTDPETKEKQRVKYDPLEQYRYPPEIESPFAPAASAVGKLGRFARRKREPTPESFTPPPSMPVEEE